MGIFSYVFLILKIWNILGYFTVQASQTNSFTLEDKGAAGVGGGLGWLSRGLLYKLSKTSKYFVVGLFLFYWLRLANQTGFRYR